MKRYKLRKDTPTIKVGTIFEEVVSDFDGAKELARITPVGAKTNPQWTIRDIDNFDEWFEEVEEPTDSIHWKPRIGDRCFILANANIRLTSYTGMLRDYNAWRTGKVFRTEEECEKALDRELAEVRLRRTSTFKPDFKNDYMPKWFIKKFPIKYLYKKVEFHKTIKITRRETYPMCDMDIRNNPRLRVQLGTPVIKDEVKIS